MCGIGGILVPRGSEAVAEGLRRMGQCMAARGPDDEGLFVGPGVGLIHRRLSILDLSELGNCPMPNEDGSIQVLLNGEIYNWRELRSGASCARPPLQIDVGQRSPFPWVRGMGRGPVCPPAWHVCFGHLGSASLTPAAGARQDRRKAAVLSSGRAANPLRIEPACPACL